MSPKTDIIFAIKSLCLSENLKSSYESWNKKPWWVLWMRILEILTILGWPFCNLEAWTSLVHKCHTQKKISGLVKRFSSLSATECILFLPTRPTDQNRPIAKIVNFCVFHLILMKFGFGANSKIQHSKIQHRMSLK